MSNITTNLLFFASALLLFRGDAVAEDSGVDDNIISGRRLSSLRAARNLEVTGPLNLFQQSTEITGNQSAEELPASQQLRGHDDNPPPPTPPLNLFKQNRIINGDEVDGGNGRYPFQVQLGWYNGWCGGSLIAPDVVLTAAHCVDLKKGDPSHVQVWDENRMEMTMRLVDIRVPHPEYDKDELYNDIALLKLAEPALAVKDVSDGSRSYWELVVENYDWINHPPMIRLHRYQTPSGCTSLYAQGLADDILTLTVIGHGTTRPGGNQAGRLMEADVHYVPNSVCNEQYWGNGISDDMLCAADTDEFEDACQGDSGGPLFTQLPVGENNLYTLVGTTSWGVGCADPEYPGVYSRVAKNTEWIDAKVCGDLSPKSCTADGKIRDYAVESLTGNSRRLAQSVNVSMNNARALKDLVLGTDYYSPATFKEELCELLGGDVDEETLPPTSSSPTITNSPSRSPIISPSMAPSESPSLMPSTFPSGSPSLPPGVSPTKNFITKNSGNKKAKGLMFQMQADEADVMLETIAFKTKDDKDTQVQVYIRLGSYEDFSDEGMNPQDWGAPLFNGVPNAVRNGFREANLDEVFTIPKGEMASIHLVGKKEIMYAEGDQEFTRADDSGDFQLSTGVATKKAFEQRLSEADFVGGITYKTYTEATKVTFAPSFSPTRVTSNPSLSPTRVTSIPSSTPSSSQLPTLPPNADTSSPSMSSSNLPSLSSSLSPSSSPTENNGGGGDGEYTTVDVYDAGDNAKGVMFSITAKSKLLTITGLGLLGKDAKESDLWIYYQDGLYKEDFDALDEDEWIQVFKDKVMLDPDELVDIELDNDISIPAGETVSLYVLSKKGIMYNKSSYDEFEIYGGNDDLALRVGTTTKKEFQQPEKLADFAGRITYQT